MRFFFPIRAAGRSRLGSSLLLAAALSVAPALAQGQIVMDFEGLKNNELIQDFYNGGTGSLGSTGPDVGVEFLGGSMGIIAASAGGDGNTSHLPSPDTVLYFLGADSAVLNVAAGFTGGFSFYYSSDVAANVVVYDGLNATGNVLATVPITAQRQNGCSDTNYCHWTAAGSTFTGTAYSVSFGGAADRTAFDNVTLGNATPGGGEPPAAITAVPTLGEGGLVLLGLLAAGLGWQRLRRQSAAQR